MVSQTRCEWHALSSRDHQRVCRHGQTSSEGQNQPGGPPLAHTIDVHGAWLPWSSVCRFGWEHAGTGGSLPSTPSVGDGAPSVPLLTAGTWVPPPPRAQGPVGIPSCVPKETDSFRGDRGGEKTGRWAPPALESGVSGFLGSCQPVAQPPAPPSAQVTKPWKWKSVRLPFPRTLLGLGVRLTKADNLRWLLQPFLGGVHVPGLFGEPPGHTS